jgi:hypothetical protein
MGFFDRMAGRLRGRIQDGTEARRLLSRLLLDVDGPPVAFGVMNLLWVAGISGFVLLEKITSANQLVSRLGGPRSISLFGPFGRKFGFQMPASSIKSGEEHPCKRLFGIRSLHQEMGS